MSIYDGEFPSHMQSFEISNQRRKAKFLKEQDFFVRLSEELPDSCLAYYPGCEDQDTVLEKALRPDQIVYLDISKLFSRPEGLRVRGDYSNPPFIEREIFDLLLYREPDASFEETKGMLRSLRVGGLFVYNITDCPHCLKPEQALAFPNLKRKPLLYEHASFMTFEKIKS